MLALCCRFAKIVVCAAVCLGSAAGMRATPANKALLASHYDRFLPTALNRCTTCHQPTENKTPETLAEIPHNSFGRRLRALGEEWAAAGRAVALPERLAAVAGEDADGDGAVNEVELLLGHGPGNGEDRPNEAELEKVGERKAEFARLMESYRWRPFQTPQRPATPTVANRGWVRNPIDAFIAAEQEARGLKPRPEASREVLMRRAFMDLVGLNPTVAEQEDFLGDRSADAYERLVDRLLRDARYGERWGRHWMDVWRYSDWAGWAGGNQIRDSKPHIWRWRDWIVESLNGDKGYDRMVVEMLAADEIAPEDTETLRATGFLVRNYKMLSREQWLEDTVKHTSQAFMGVTMGCAKCHDHMYDPILQTEYYQLRAIFEPHQVRTDRVPGELDRMKNGLVRTYDAAAPATYFFVRGDERQPDTNRVMRPSVPRALRWEAGAFGTEEVALPRFAAFPDQREFVIRDSVREREEALAEALAGLAKAPSDPRGLRERQLARAVAEAKLEALQAVLAAETAGEAERANRAADAQAAQRKAALLEAKWNVARAEAEETAALREAGEAAAKGGAAPKGDRITKARQKLEETRKALAQAGGELQAAPSAEFKPRPVENYPATSTGRRLAFAKWLTDPKHPLTARVAMNQIWLRHFGRGIVPTPADFGGNGVKPTHPQLLDWLAAEFVAKGWSMKEMHRLILTSATYRMASTADEENLARDPDNHYLWRMPSRRLDAELVRDNLLHAAGNMDATMGGPEIDHLQGLTSKRRSIYLRIAAEKEVEFLKIFDGPAVTECYVRHPTVMPQQALALANSEMALAQARALAASISTANAGEFIETAFRRVLARSPKPAEADACAELLVSKPHAARARENLALVLFNHNDFVTVR